MEMIKSNDKFFYAVECEIKPPNSGFDIFR